MSATSHFTSLNVKDTNTASFRSEEETLPGQEGDTLPPAVEVLKPSSNSDYINKIRKALNEDVMARQEREKRRRKVLVDQMRAHEAQEVRLSS